MAINDVPRLRDMPQPITLDTAVDLLQHHNTAARAQPFNGDVSQYLARKGRRSSYERLNEVYAAGYREAEPHVRSLSQSYRGLRAIQNDARAAHEQLNAFLANRPAANQQYQNYQTQYQSSLRSLIEGNATHLAQIAVRER